MFGRQPKVSVLLERQFECVWPSGQLRSIPASYNKSTLFFVSVNGRTLPFGNRQKRTVDFRLSFAYPVISENPNQQMRRLVPTW